MGRKLFLVGIMVTVERGSVTQLVVGTVFSAVYLLLQVQVGPYEDLGDDFLAAGCSFAIVVFFVCCIMFKLSTLTELDDLQRRMSYEQIQDFAVPTWVMTQVLMLTILGTLFGSLIIFIIQLSREEKRRRDELRAKRARRLRYLKDARSSGSNVSLAALRA